MGTCRLRADASDFAALSWAIFGADGDRRRLAERADPVAFGATDACGRWHVARRSGVFIAISGTLGFIVSGWGVAGLPPLESRLHQPVALVLVAAGGAILRAIRRGAGAPAGSAHAQIRLRRIPGAGRVQHDLEGAGGLIWGSAGDALCCSRISCARGCHTLDGIPGSTGMHRGRRTI